MPNLLKYFFALAFITSISLSHADSFDYGISADREVFHVDTTDGDDLAIMTTGNTYSPYISYRITHDNTKPHGWDYFYEFSLGSYSINRQQLSVGDYIDLGTKVEGNYAYFTPTWFYKIPYSPTSHLSIGIGAGIGYLSAKGNAVLTESSNNTININISETNISAALYLEYVSNDWVYKILANGPRVSDGVYDYQLSQIKLIVGRRLSW